ncbi:MAG TPA: nucleoid-associated protein [Bacilli bacterium]|nr:nucleoid-associated protein [Bacilli bacterium]
MGKNNHTLVNLVIQHVTTNIIYSIQDDGSKLPSFVATKLTNLGSETIDLLRTRIIDVLGRTGKSIELEEDSTLNLSTVKHMSTIIVNDHKLLEVTPFLVNHLADSQKTRLIKDSIVLIIKGKYGLKLENDYCCLIKAEIDSIFSIDQLTENEVKVQMISNAFLGKEQKLYKIAFVSIDSNQESKILVFDKNVERATLQGAAMYFYKDFLGCKIKNDNSLYTVDFFRLTQEYIKNEYDSDYYLHMHLFSYLRQTGNNVIDINEFAKNCFSSTNEIEMYINYMVDNDYPTNLVIKDMNKVLDLTKRKKLIFDNGITINIPYTSHELIKIELDKYDSEHKITIIGKLL